MPDPVSTSRRLGFGPFEADLHCGELLKHGVRVRLQAQPFRLLAMLLERPATKRVGVKLHIAVKENDSGERNINADAFGDRQHRIGTFPQASNLA